MKWKNIFVVPIVAASLIVYSCHTSSGSITKSSAFPKTLERAKKDKRSLILYSGVDTFAVTSVTVENRRESTVHLDRMDSVGRTTLNNPTVLPERRAHLYMLDSASYTLDEPHTLLFRKLGRIELTE